MADRGERVTLATEGARHLDAYCAHPENGRGTGLVILHDMFGPGPVFEDLADTQAGRGRAALLPNFFWRSEPAGLLSYDAPHETAWEREKTFDLDRAVADLQVAIAWLRRAPFCNGKVAVWGFCMSGNLAFMAASRTDVDAAFAFYALGIARSLDTVARIACPVQLHYGLADEHVPWSEIDAVKRAAAASPRIEIHLYPGAGHSFFNPVRPTYDHAASALAAERVDALLARFDAA